ncbi:dual specificity mitogen-activated protein kinase kinase 3 isoform X2 [Molossus molossus]|nr:dual specificity mitogen-activated protein kinase kinase 3 isoform X2 [Molossus molossus]
MPNPTPPRNLDSRTFITIGDRNFEVEADDLVTISELGRGAYGVVEKVRHAQSGTIMAVKRIRATVNSQEQKRLLMDLDINMRTVDCFYTVTFYGALFREGDVWICMELMDTSLDKFYRKVLDKNMTIPEDILGEIAVSVVRALEHLHSKLSVIHRDVKPSNVLINKEGHVKMCDFGISGQLEDSMAKTMDAGCKPYMAPERINPELNQKGYNVKSDVWSFGITMPEEESRRAHELPGADGASLLHLTQNQEDSHRCLCEGDPGGGRVDGPPGSPEPAGQCSPAPISCCHAGLGHSGRTRGGWSQVPQKQTVRVPCRAHGASPVPLSCCSKDPGLAGTGMPCRHHPSQRRQLDLCAAWAQPRTPPSCIFFYFLTEWTLRTLT